MINEIRKEIQELADPQRAVHSARYFKTGKGEYAEGDIFLGLTVPQSRTIAKMFSRLFQEEIDLLLHSKFHEERLIALLILIEQYKKGDTDRKKEIYEYYLSNTKYIDNWDLIDTSADMIVGEYLLGKSKRDADIARSVLTNLAKSESIWERRIAILSTFAFLRDKSTGMTFAIADILLHDSHDLIHKAVGWLLREAGKLVSEKEEETFLKTRYKTMPRTMLRYAIERFPKEKRDQYLKGEI